MFSNRLDKAKKCLQNIQESDSASEKDSQLRRFRRLLSENAMKSDINKIIAPGMAKEFYNRISGEKERSFTLLSLAIVTGNEDAFKVLMEYQDAVQLNVNQLDNEKKSALFDAVNEGRNWAISPLLVAGADLIAGGNVITRAIEVGNNDALETILHFIPFITPGKAPSDQAHFQPIFAAIHCGNYKGLELLISNGGNINVLDSEGETPLYYAANLNNREMVKMLLMHGARLDFGKYSPFFEAIISGRTGLLEDIIAGAGSQLGIDKLNPNGKTGVHLAVQFGQCEALRILIKNRANLSIADFHGVTPLCQALQKKNYYATVLLLENMKGDDLQPNELEKCKKVASKLFDVIKDELPIDEGNDLLQLIIEGNHSIFKQIFPKNEKGFGLFGSNYQESAKEEYQERIKKGDAIKFGPAPSSSSMDNDQRPERIFGGL